MLERKWPPIRNALIWRLLIPYLIYLALFSSYTLNLREFKKEMHYGNEFYTWTFYIV